MIRRVGKNLGVADRDDVPEESRRIERDGWALLHGVLDAGEVAALIADVDRVFDEYPPDVRTRVADRSQFRYEMYNRSAVAQKAIAHPRILEVIEPLLGDDCHVIANTCWRNPADHEGGPWHCDAGPHVPRPVGIDWDDRIPYPVFVIGAHLWLWDVDRASGPTSVVPGSHRSGRLPPSRYLFARSLSYQGRSSVAPGASAGDVLLFSSDIWHRGMPAGPKGTGRLFIQCHYGRRDIAQRNLTTADVNQVSPPARDRIESDRERTLLGLHRPFFYDG